MNQPAQMELLLLLKFYQTVMVSMRSCESHPLVFWKRQQPHKFLVGLVFFSWVVIGIAWFLHFLCIRIDQL